MTTRPIPFELVQGSPPGRFDSENEAHFRKEVGDAVFELSKRIYQDVGYPTGSVTVDDYKARPVFNCEYIENTVEIVITTPSDTKTFTGLSGGGSVTYTVATDTQDDLSTESALAVDQTRAGYTVVFYSAAGAGEPATTMFKGSIHGVTTFDPDNTPALVIETETEVNAAITFIGTNSAAAANCSLPTHAVGDVAVVLAVRQAHGTPPTLPSGWTNISTANRSSAISSRQGYRVLVSGDTVSGNWVNASHVEVSIYRGVKGTDPIGASGSNANNSTSIDTTDITMESSDGTSFVLVQAAQETGGGVLSGRTMSGTGLTMTTRSVGQTADRLVSFDSGGIEAWPADMAANKSNTFSHTAHTVELLAAINSDYMGRGIPVDGLSGNMADGFSQRKDVNETWDTIMEGDGTHTDNDDFQAQVLASSTTNQYAAISRGLIVWDCRHFSPFFDVLGATLTLTPKASGIVDQLGGQTVVLTEATVATKTAIAVADYQAQPNKEAATLYSDAIDITSLEADTEQVFTLTAAGIAALQEAIVNGGFFVMGVRIGAEAADSVGSLTWASGEEAKVIFYDENTNDTDDPKLTISGIGQYAKVVLRLSDPDSLADRIEYRVLNDTRTDTAWTNLVTSPSAGVLSSNPISVQLTERLRFAQARLIYTLDGNQIYGSPITSSGFDIGRQPRVKVTLKVSATDDVTPRIEGDFDTNSVRVYAAGGPDLEDPTVAVVAALAAKQGRIFTESEVEDLYPSTVPISLAAGATAVVAVIPYSGIAGDGIRGPMSIARYTRPPAPVVGGGESLTAMTFIPTDTGSDVDFDLSWTPGSLVTDDHTLAIVYESFITAPGAQATITVDPVGVWTGNETAVESAPLTDTSNATTDTGGGDGAGNTTHRVTATLKDSGGNVVPGAVYTLTEDELS